MRRTEPLMRTGQIHRVVADAMSSAVRNELTYKELEIVLKRLSLLAEHFSKRQPIPTVENLDVYIDEYFRHEKS